LRSTNVDDDGMSPIDEERATGPPGRAVSPRVATVVGITLGLLLVGLFATAMVVVGNEEGGSPDLEEHVELDPLTGAPLEDRCHEAPQMCGDDAGGVDNPCDEAGMCGDVSPGDDAREVDAGSDPCTGELCGEVGPGTEDSTGP
jgi:hypothetical protein